MDTEPTAPHDQTPPPRVDLARPLLAQIDGLGEAYYAWVDDGIGPNTAKTCNRGLVELDDPIASSWPSSLRIFHSTVLERLSHISWWMIPLIWLPINAALLLSSVHALGLGWLHAVGWALVGLCAWTLTEYVLHRFVFHYRPRSAFGRKVHFLAHGIHHLDPWDPTRLVFPPLAGIGVASALFGLWLLLLPLPETTALMGGLLTGYVVYDLTHYYTHHARPKSRWGRHVKAWHLAHHHKFPTRMYGVSSPLWDLLLGSGRPDGYGPQRRVRTR